MSEETTKEEKTIPHAPLKKGEKTIRAVLKVKHFIVDGSEEQDNKINEFLETIDNVTRFLNARNAYQVKGKSCLLIWYLEKLAEDVPVEEFGAKEEVKEETKSK